MNIVVLGAGTVGRSIAELLCDSGHSVTVVDQNAKKTRRINDELDVRAITGSASTSSVLFQAGILSCDVVLAVTGIDEVNIIAASMSKAMGARRAIARVYSPVFRDLSTFDYEEHFNIDRLLSLEHLTAVELATNLRNLGSALMEHFARGGLEVFEIVINEKSSDAGKMLRDLKLPPSVRIGTISRNNKMKIAAADHQLQIGDRILVFSRPEDVATIKSRFKQIQEMKRRIFIAGGGETGLHLASKLERQRFSVTILESNTERCNYLASHLEFTQVVNCNASQRDVMKEEGVGNADTFVACLGNDENNILAGVEARDLGAAEVMAVVNRPDYRQVISKLGIDLAVSARQVMAQQILSYLHEGAVIRRQTLPGGIVELIELNVIENSAATQSTLAEFQVPAHFLLVALDRKQILRIPTAKDQLRSDDQVILLVNSHDADVVIRFFTKPG